MRDKAEAVLIQAEKAPVGERHVHMKEHMNMLEDIMSQLQNEHPAPNMSAESLPRSTRVWFVCMGWAANLQA